MSALITIRMRQQPALPLEAECLCPDLLAGLSAAEIRALPLIYGSTDMVLGDFCEVTVTSTAAALPSLRLEGDFSRVKRIGQAMGCGEIEVEGSVGFHCGAKMQGGRLTVHGDAGDWLGAQMEGGVICVDGSAGHSVGAAYRGLECGMRGGEILIRGNAGQMVGAKMRGGLIAVGGSVGDTPAYHMKAGTVVVVGQTGRRVAAGMLRGTVVLLGGGRPMATFYPNCNYRPSFWGLLCKEMRKQGFPLPEQYSDPLFCRYSGDFLEGGKGEVLLCL